MMVVVCGGGAVAHEHMRLINEMPKHVCGIHANFLKMFAPLRCEVPSSESLTNEAHGSDCGGGL